MTARNARYLVLLLLVAVLSLPVVYAITHGLGFYAILGSVGLLVLSFIMRSKYRMPLILMCLCVLCADSNHVLLHKVGLKMRWAVLGLVVFMELSYWASIKQVRLQITSVHLAFAGFLTLALTSTLYSGNSLLTFQRSISMVLFFVVVFLYFWRQIETSTVRLDFVTFISKLIPLLYLLEILYAFVFPAQAWSKGRLRCLSGNPNGLGQLVMITLPFLYWQIISGVKVRARLRLYIWMAIPFGLALLFLSGSRASLLGLAVCLLVITYRLRQRYFLVLLMIVAIVMVLALAYSKPFASRIERAPIEGSLAKRLGHMDMGGRSEAWIVAMEIALETPFFGHGFGTAMETFGKRKFKIHYGGYPHNFILHMFVDIGGIGVALVVLLHLLLLRGAWRCLSAMSKTIDNGLPVLAAGLYIAGLLNACFESWMFSAGSPVAFPFWIMTMLMAKYAIEIRQAKSLALRNKFYR